MARACVFVRIPSVGRDALGAPCPLTQRRRVYKLHELCLVTWQPTDGDGQARDVCRQRRDMHGQRVRDVEC
ncbi:MAG: hypothetical protein FWG72_10995 [Oscillospiraceae bacterium]|nr:hypothetical protein [Oscillospiraceae bacterium]